MTFPQNEAETIKLFQFLEPWIGWEIVHLQRKFPDAIIANSHGAELVAEFEFLSANYRDHDHPNEGCDLIVCFRDNWPDAPIPVWALEEIMFPEKRKVLRIKHRVDQLTTENAELRCKVSDLEREVRFLRHLNKVFREEIWELRTTGFHPIAILNEDGEEIRSFYVPFAYPKRLYSERWED